MQRIIDRKRGTLIGLAVGDALGAAIEFRPPGTFEPVTGYRDGGPHHLKAGEWTDDTSMALALAASIGDDGWDLDNQNIDWWDGWNLDNQMAHYIDWWHHGRYSVNGRCFDIGNTTRNALRNYVASKNVRTSGGTSESASGNGSIMRLAPVPIRYAADFYPSRIDRLCLLASESSIPTHANEQCKSACRYLATVLAALIAGEKRNKVLSPDWMQLQFINNLYPLHFAINKVAKGSYRHSNPPEIKGSGWVVQSLEAALWAFHDANSFEEAVLKAVNLGDDADTTGAVCGQLAGAYWGESGIPQSLRSGLARMDMIEDALACIL